MRKPGFGRYEENGIIRIVKVQQKDIKKKPC
jgi:hypothetical protein